MMLSELSLLEMSVMGSVLIGFTVLLRKTMGQRLTPGCYLALWALAGARLLIPIAIASPFSIYHLFAAKSSAVAESIDKAPLWLHIDVQQMTVSAETGNSIVDSFNWLLVIWLLGALVCFVYMISSHLRCRRWYAASLPVERAFAKRWQQEHHLHRHYKICHSPLVHTPLTYGLFRPVILLPEAQTMTDEELHLVLLHEWNHIRHLDILWQWLLMILCSIHWFNPTVWVMYILCRQDLELHCDAVTVRQLKDGQNRSYALLLLHQAAQVNKYTPVFSSSRFTGYQRMEERIRMIMKPRKFSWVLAAVMVVLLCVCGAAFATTAIGDGNNTPTLLAADENKSASDTLVWPVTPDNTEITMLYGIRKHPITGEEKKIDHICIGGENAEGSDVMAAASGIVKEAGYDAQKGYYLLIQHDNGLETCSWHCEQLLVEEGDKVSAYQQIATLGRTGDATGPCLSFAVYKNGEAVDPMEHFDTAEKE